MAMALGFERFGELIEEYKGFRIYRDGSTLTVVNASNSHFVRGQVVAVYFGDTVENVKAYLDGILEIKERDGREP